MQFAPPPISDDLIANAFVSREFAITNSFFYKRFKTGFRVQGKSEEQKSNFGWERERVFSN